MFKGDRYNFKDGEPNYGQTSRMIGSFGEDSASIGKFFEAFPSVKSLFEKMPAVKQKTKEIVLEEGNDFDEDILYGNFLIILMGEEAYSNGGIATIFKSPYYLAHDLGHISMDFSESSSLKYELQSLIEHICSLYSNEEETSEEDSGWDDDSSMLYDIKDFSNQDEDELWHSGIPYFFNTTNANHNDTYPDIFAELTETGTLEHSIPRSIQGDNHNWVISEQNAAIADDQIKSFIDSQKESISEGVLQDHYGNVIFM